MDDDIQTLRKTERLAHLDLYSHSILDERTAQAVSDAADRVVIRYHALMKDMPVLPRVAMASAVMHPTESSVAKGALMLSLIEDQTTSRVNDSVCLQSVYDNVCELLGDSHFFEILEGSAESCALAVFCQTAALATNSGRYIGFQAGPIRHSDMIYQLMREHGLCEGDELLLSRGALAHEHVSMLMRIIA